MANTTKISRILLSTILILSILGILWGCAGIHKEVERTGCSPLPDGFSGADLVGTWIAESYVHPQKFDTLIFREDGTYKQIIYLENPPTEYTTDWQLWLLELDEKRGIGYLHLQRMRACAASPYVDCDWVSDGEIPVFDYCLHRWIEPPPGELILLVTGTSADSIASLQFTRGPESSPWVYEFQEP